MMMRLSVAALVLARLAACGSSPDDSTPDGSSLGSSTQPADTTIDPEVRASIEAEAGIPPEPDAATTQAYIDALNAIDPRIVDGKVERAVRRGRNQCTSVKDFPNDQAKLVDLTRQRFSTSVDFGAEVAESILAAVRKYICPTY